MSKILVTGGLGTVGKVLVRTLSAREHTVKVSGLEHYHAEDYVRCDVASFMQVSRLFDSDRFDYVYHLAAEFGRWNGEDYYDRLWMSNAIGTKNIIRMQQKHGFRLIHFSSSEVYGDYDGVMTEDVMDKHEIRQLNDYALSKWVNEQQIMNSAAMHGTESVRVRLFNTYGPGEYYSPYRSVICLFIYRALHGLPYKVYLGHHRTSSYVTDTCETLANIVDNFKPGEVYNVGGTEYHDIKTLSDIILNYLNKPDTKVEYLSAEPFTTRDKRVSMEKAKRDLNHEPRIALAVGVPKTIEWMRDVYVHKKGLVNLEAYL
ncbi:MAG TPA: NAD(P)-dependent oxidoreductase [Gemmatimonadales bacterium]|nr:NAD(P)-dependent oxidoreductase [Gemmatimonadales bacterium]